MNANELGRSSCNIARSLSVIGDRWTLMIMHELGEGARRFESLQARTGISSHLLAGRLKRLELEGILERHVYNTRPLRHEYIPTAKGKGLDQVLLTLRKWNIRWCVKEPRGDEVRKLFEQEKGEFLGPSWNAPKDEMFSFDDCVLVFGSQWIAEREVNMSMFHSVRQASAEVKRNERRSRAVGQLH